MAVLKGAAADIYWGTSASSTFTTEAMTDVGGAHTTFTITASAKRMWDPNQTTTIYKTGSPVTDYSELRYCGGTVVWGASQGAVAMTATGKYFTVAQMTQCKGWTLSGFVEREDITALGSGAGHILTPTVLFGTVTVNEFYAGSGGLGLEVLDSGTYPVAALVLYENYAAGTRWECYGQLDSTELGIEAGGIIPETLQFTILGKYGIYHYDS